MLCYGVVLVQRNVNQWTEAEHLFSKAGKAVLSLKSPRTMKDLRLTWNSIDTQGQMEGQFFHLKVFQGDKETKDSWITSVHEQSIATIAAEARNMGVIFEIWQNLVVIHSFSWVLKNRESLNSFLWKKIVKSIQIPWGKHKWRQSTWISPPVFPTFLKHSSPKGSMADIG